MVTTPSRPAPARGSTDGSGALFIDPGGDEFDQTTVLANHSERRKLRSGELFCEFDGRSKDACELDLPSNARGPLDQSGDSLRGESAGHGLSLHGTFGHLSVGNAARVWGAIRGYRVRMTESAAHCAG